MNEFNKILISNGITDKTDLIKVNYGLEVLKNEFSKFVLMSIAFFLVGSITEFVFAFLMLAPIRIFSGGFHMSSKLLCQLFSFTVFILAIFLLPSLVSNMYAYFTMQILSIVITIIVSPVINMNLNVRKNY